MTHPTMPEAGSGGFPACRSILFVPGDRPERFARALAAGADAVCIDLEDSVAPGGKDRARRAVARFLTERSRGPGEGGATESSPLPADSYGNRTSSPVLLVVRVNDKTSSEGACDAATLASCPSPDAFMIPKVRTGLDVQDAARALPAAALLPLIETARGLENAQGVAACDSVTALIFGGFDLAIELGAEPRWEALLYARSRVVHAAALGGLDAIDMPSRNFGEMSGLREEAIGARRLGFTGKVAIHPAQIPVIHEVFTPSADEVRRAREIVEADRAAGGSAVALAGRMVDRPVVEAARRVLQRARPGATA
ncbi:MAG: CoA ester lyase [Gemmatimonadetes bacterium]|nr:CoA ester lyase [Gemmatimonadota bacterium]